MSPGLLEIAGIEVVWLLSLAGPVVIPLRTTVCVPASSRIVRLVNAFNVGGSFTASTVLLFVIVRPPRSPLLPHTVLLRSTVIVALPDWLANGANVSVPVVPGFVYVTVGFGISPGLL